MATKKEQILQEIAAHLEQNIGNKLTPALATGLLNIIGSLLPNEEPTQKD